MRALPSRSSAILLALALATGVALVPSELDAQAPAPVELSLEGVFGGEALIGDGYTTLVVTAFNRTQQTFRGRVLVRVTQWGQPPDRHVLALDLPPGERRRVLMTLFVAASGTSIEASYEVDGRTLGAASQSASYAPAGRSLVLFASPPRLRASLLELQVNAVDTAGASYPGATGTERAVPVPVGLVSLDPATGDPIVPDDVLGWSTVAVVAAQLPMLARLSQRELEALRQWVHAGGHLVLFPRTPGDLASPLVRELFGNVRMSEEAMLFPGEFVPQAIPALDCGSTVTERFGCATLVGAGTAHLLAYDASAPPYVDRPEVRELMRSIVQRALRDPGRTRLPLGRGVDDLQTAQWWDGRPSLSRLRATLDPNEGYRPALGLVGIVLFFYVLIVGPLNFRFVLHRNQPTLALLTTPLLAFGCALLMLFVGYLGKGVMMRYRRVELVEAMEGEAIAPARAYAGYFLTAPSSVEIEGRPGGHTLRLAPGGGDDGLVYDHAGERPRLGEMRGGLWETIFLRDDRIIDLGGAIRFGYDGDQLVSITNGSSQVLRGAFVLDESRVYPLGDIEAGATRPIPRAASTVLPAAYDYGDREESPTAAELARQLGLSDDEHAGYLAGVLRLLGGPSASPSDAMLWAHLDPEPAPATSPGFTREQDLRLLMLRPRARYDVLARAPMPISDDSAWGQDHAPPIPPLPPHDVPPDDVIPPHDVIPSDDTVPEAPPRAVPNVDALPPAGDEVTP